MTSGHSSPQPSPRKRGEGAFGSFELDRLAERGRSMLLDLFYVAIATGSLVACWWFVKACDRL